MVSFPENGVKPLLMHMKKLDLIDRLLWQNSTKCDAEGVDNVDTPPVEEDLLRQTSVPRDDPLEKMTYEEGKNTT